MGLKNFRCDGTELQKIVQEEKNDGSFTGGEASCFSYKGLPGDTTPPPIDSWKKKEKFREGFFLNATKSTLTEIPFFF